jgi:cytosine/adenosine deaminase-related metal-dependent hydrolase
MQIVLAQLVCPIASPAIVDGGVAISAGRIVHVGTRADVVRACPGTARLHDLEHAALLPGLVNAHTHLELSAMGGAGLPRGDYATWLRALLAARAVPDPERGLRAAEREIEALASRGTVAVGDIGNLGSTAPLLARSRLHAVSFHEIYGLVPGEAEAAALLDSAAAALETLAGNADIAAARERLVLALTPHAPHTTSFPLLRALAGRAAPSSRPLSVHVAESEAETELLATGGGPLAELFAERGFLPRAFDVPACSPVAHLARAGLLGPRTLAVHCVQLDAADRAILRESGATVVTCPRSNEALGVGRAPVPALLREGVPVALGTDSLASVDDLDPFAEMAALARAHPELPPDVVLHVATLAGARALGFGDRLGSIERGKLAELIVVPLGQTARARLEALYDEPQRVFRLAEALRELAGAGS